MGTRKKSALTVRDAQRKQPWTVPYARGVEHAAKIDVPHILASHCALHAAKSVGKLAAVFEELDHPHSDTSPWGRSEPSAEQLATVMAMSADLFTAALRFANLYGFDLADELERRVLEKNGVPLRGRSKA